MVWNINVSVVPTAVKRTSPVDNSNNHQLAGGVANVSGVEDEARRALNIKGLAFDGKRELVLIGIRTSLLDDNARKNDDDQWFILKRPQPGFDNE